jgi:hypothetical protein
VPTVAAKNTIPQEVATNQFEITASPNPSNHFFTVKINTSNKNEVVTLRILNISGQTIEARLMNFDQTIKLGENYKSGIYLVEVTQGDQRRTLKLIKQ